MATSGPTLDFYNELVELLRENYERTAFPDGGLEDCDGEAGRIYNDGFKRPYVCKLMADVLSGRWQLGTTQEEISERLGIMTDRGWMSRALHKGGPLSLDVFMRLRCCPTRPTDWEPDIEMLRPDMDRSAFIGVAKYLAGCITDRPTLAPQRLDEFNYELICEILGNIELWLPHYARRDAGIAQELIANVVRDTRRGVIPVWYSQGPRRRVEKEIDRILSDPRAALEHLSQLQRDWLDVFAATHRMILDLTWSEP